MSVGSNGFHHSTSPSFRPTMSEMIGPSTRPSKIAPIEPPAIAYRPPGLRALRGARNERFAQTSRM